MAAGDTNAFPAGTTTKIASGATGLLAEVSPDLPPGRTLSIAAGGDVNIVAAADAPAADLHRPWIIEVMDSPIATMFNRTKGTSYGPLRGTRWYDCILAASDGDLIEISPGAINSKLSDANTAYAWGLDNTGMAIVRGVTIRNIPGRGRWRVWPVGIDVNTVAPSASGITIFEPGMPEMGGRKTIVIEGFDVSDQFGTARDAYGIRIRANKSGSDPTGAWTDYHTSVTVKNFKVGKSSGLTGSGLSGTAENLTYEDGDVFDCGQSGLEHNAYTSARVLTVRGVRSRRTRGGGSMDGHIFKTRAANSVFEGCVFDASGAADNTDVLQLANGGNHTITGCLFIQGTNPSGNNGIVVYENEQAGNVPWYYGVDGHSVTMRRNVFISRAVQQYGWGCPMFMARPPGHSQYVSGATITVQDNIGANATLASTYWIGQGLLSTSGLTQLQDWTVSNSVVTYDAADSAFTNTKLLEYRRAAGPIAASGSLTTKRLQFPHGYVARTDSYRGLA